LYEKNCLFIVNSGGNSFCLQYISDGGGMNLYNLIIKGEIRRLHYDLPGYFRKDEVCTGRPDRVSILKIDDLFESYFHFKKAPLVEVHMSSTIRSQPFGLHFAC